jgi:hypothetical protein
LFQLTSSVISAEDLKRAKKQVLMLHPDKSHLPAQYFLFYKKAFDIIVQFYDTQHKMKQEVKHEEIKYQSNFHHSNDKSTTRQIANTAKSMVENGKFQEKFNTLFEENYIDKTKPTKNDWFSKNDPLYEYDEPVTNKNMNQTFETIKQQNQGMVVHRGIQTIQSCSSSRANQYYDDDEDDDGTYVCSDPFSKLKFDDLRKVHKDQTIFSVGEKDIEKIPKYSSMDEYSRTRESTIQPLQREQAESLLQQEEKQWRDQMLQKEYESKKKGFVYEEKNKAVLSHFLRLT